MKFNSLIFLVTSIFFATMSAVCVNLYIYINSGGEVILEWEAFSGGNLSIILLFVADYISVLFFSTVLMISSGVFLFSVTYMSMDKFSSRFSMLVISFVASMSLLIFSPSLISLLLGWDGLGVTSYLLVCYYASEKSFNASMLTALTNRLGDVAILITIGIWGSSGLYNFGILSSSNMVGNMTMFLVLVVAAMTKSAQMPFSSWLPAAMAAPTPVSALVHSSTLVTAGVYLMIRFNYWVSMSGYSWVLLWLGLFTMTMAGGSALFELDLKKIIALSTLSQLGVMFFSLGMSQPFMAFFHLVSHAYFKAMLFMAAGAMIHSVKDYQDLRKMGSLMSSTPMIASVMLVSNLSLCGLPFLAGFYSKDLILESFMMGSMSMLEFTILMLATILTVLYSCRLTLNLFAMNSGRESFSLEGDADKFMVGGMSILLLPSIMGGWMLSGLMSFNSIIFLPNWEKLLVLVMILVMGAWFIISNIKMSPSLNLMKMIHEMWFMPSIFSPGLTKKTLSESKYFFKVSDPSWVPHVVWSWMIPSNLSSAYTVSGYNMSLMSSFIVVILIVLIL